MELKVLIKEVNYQEEYSYDKKIELFNKYGISTALNFFNPIYELAKFILGDNNNPRIGYCPYSHSGNIASSFNENFKKGKSDKIKLHDNGSITISKYEETKINDDYIWEYKPVIRFLSAGKTVKIFSYDNFGVSVKRGLYESIDQWLIDFGYENW
jgi:hypothetical protein